MPPQSCEQCFHCALPIAGAARYFARVDGAARAMCCAGCAAVAEAIVQAGLDDYYRHRTATPVPPELAGADAATLADPEVLHAESIRHLDNGHSETILALEGMTCAACAWLIEQRLRQVDGVSHAAVNFSGRRARVCWDPQRVKLARIAGAVDALGYRSRPYDRRTAEVQQRRERRTMLWQVFVAGLGSMQVMMYTIPLYLSDGDISADLVALMRWASLLLTVPVLAFSAVPFFRGAWRDLATRRLGMDVPIALGILTAFVPSVWATLTRSGEVYFDAVSMFIFLLLGGRYLETMARNQAGDTVERLARRMPQLAQRMLDFPNSWSTAPVPSAQLRAGDVILVQPGESVAADGVVVEGESELDESLLTGEAAPVVRHKGAAVIAAAVNRLHPIVVQVTRTGADSTIGVLTRLLERALAEKPRVVQLAERAASWFVAAILLVAIGVFAAWLPVDPSRAVWTTVAVLVVTCPCALALATPAALTAAMHAAARRGVLITRGHALESAAQLKHIALDKTGTLTHGRLEVVEVRPLSELSAHECLVLAALLESGSEHPIGKAIRASAALGSASAEAMRAQASMRRLSDVRVTPGAGIEAQVDALPVRLGTLAFVAALGGKGSIEYTAKPGETFVALGDEFAFLAIIVLRDTLRREAKSAIAQLRALGVAPVLLSGDQLPAVEAVATQLGIEQYAAAQSPADKLERIRALPRGGPVAMVGDGLNDAPGLAGAALAIAMGGGTDLAQTSADVVLMADRLDHLAYLIALGRKTRAVIRQNLAWAIGYNALAVPFAALGYVTPWMAGLGMALSSLLVVLNALRLSAPLEQAAMAPIDDPVEPLTTPAAA